MKQNKSILTTRHIHLYSKHLREQECSTSTIQKYTRDITVLFKWLNGTPLTKTALIQWKEMLTIEYATSTVNSMLAAVNGFLNFIGRQECSVKLLKIQKSMFCDEKRELTHAEYMRLVRAAQRQKNQRLALIIQTICVTGIRVSELKFITVRAVQTGRTEIVNKGKRRTVFLPDKLCHLLKKYLRTQKITAGAVFVTRTGKPVDRCNIWRDMKRLCESAKVEQRQVFPHNLRHLFARTYYTIEKDLSRLADILGHSSINTTRLYTIESGVVHARQVEHIGSVLLTT